MLTSITLSLSTHCPASCIFCPSNRHEISTERNMSLETVKHIVDQVVSTELVNTVNKFEISENGDCLCNPNVLDILRYIRKSLPNVYISIFSNFALFDKRIAEILLSEKLIDNVITNIDSTNPELYKIIKNLYFLL